MRAVVATYLGLPYELTPAISGLADAATFWGDWNRWLLRRGYTMAAYDYAPGHLQRWIAIVGSDARGPLHAVLMAGTELFHDPILDGDRLTRVERSHVRCAIVIGAAAHAAWTDQITHEIGLAVSRGSSLVWCLEDLMDCEWGVGMYRRRGRHADADAMQRRLGEPD